jgi:hypothetical protein
MPREVDQRMGSAEMRQSSSDIQQRVRRTRDAIDSRFAQLKRRITDAGSGLIALAAAGIVIAGVAQARGARRRRPDPQRNPKRRKR